MYFKLRNASTSSRHKQFSFRGIPSNVWYMKSWDKSADLWKPTFGTIITVLTSEWVSQGAYLQLCCVDRDGNLFHKSCQNHRERTGESSAFVFRDPEHPEVIYTPNVSYSKRPSCKGDFKIHGYVTIPFSGNKLEILSYPVCNIKCRGQMVENKAGSGFMKPDSDAFRSLFPALCCQLMVNGVSVSQYSCRVRTK